LGGVPIWECNTWDRMGVTNFGGEERVQCGKDRGRGRGDTDENLANFELSFVGALSEGKNTEKEEGGFVRC